MEIIKIAVGSDQSAWHSKFISALARKNEEDKSISYDIINLDNNDWIDTIINYDVIIWKPSCMGPRKSSLFKEKIYFIEKYLNKLVIPNFFTIWHFESKIAQSYLFKQFNIATPKTFVSFDYHDAVSNIDNFNKPLIFKKYYGAGSKNVWIESNKNKIIFTLSRCFSQQLWKETKDRFNSKLSMLNHIHQIWFWEKLKQKICSDELNVNTVYWQDFIPKNTKDLRITIIGNKYGFGFWRHNRNNDFRASGSGIIDYETPIPEAPLKECFKINRLLDFDSMAYDILFDSEKFVITEMSYAYVDTAVYNCKQHYEIDESGKMITKNGHVWPQDLWVEWALHRVKAKLITKDSSVTI